VVISAWTSPARSTRRRSSPPSPGTPTCSTFKPDAKLALAFTFAGEPDYPRLAALARAIMGFAAPSGKRNELLVLMIDGDVAAVSAHHRQGAASRRQAHLDRWCPAARARFVDIGELLDPPGVVPVVIKSLLFS